MARLFPQQKKAPERGLFPDDEGDQEKFAAGELALRSSS